MRPLIEIQTIPIEIQMKTTNAHLEYARGTAQMEVSRDHRPEHPAGGSPGTACGIRGYRRPGAGGPHDDGGQN